MIIIAFKQKHNNFFSYKKSLSPSHQVEGVNYVDNLTAPPMLHVSSQQIP